mgnify:CR=1 FL=1
MVISFKIAIFICLASPLILTLMNIFYYENEANPLETLTNMTGEWAIICLLITLTLNPLKKIFNKNIFIKVRRQIGLWAALYILLHALTWIFFDKGLYIQNEAEMVWNEVIDDILDKPYILLGTLSLLLTIPLALSSNKYSIKKLGKKWKRLHSLIYLITPLGIIHFWMAVKSDYFWPAIYLSIFIGLMLIRLKIKT